MVADIIEAAQNLKGTCPWAGPGKTRPLNPWTRHSSGTLSGWLVPTAIKEQDVKIAFGQVEVIELYGMDEFAFLTAQMTEGEFKKGAVSYDARETGAV